jgi:transposase
LRVQRQRKQSKRRPAIQLQVKTVLNAIQRFPGFVFHDIRLQRHRDGQLRCLEITVQPHPAIAAKCSRCLKPAPGYDRLEQRSWLFVPMWGLVTWFVYAARRVECPEHGVVIEHVPWSAGKRPVTIAMMGFLSRWARRLLWVGRKRTQATLRRGLDALGSEVVGGLQYVCSDMWKPYLRVLAQRVGQALHILDRFHITMHLNQAVDQVRRAESTRLKGQPLAERLKKMRWKLLRKGSHVRGRAKLKLEGLLASRLATGRAWDLKEAFQHFWKYRSPIWAGGFLDYWTERAMRSRLEPMKKVARMLRAHEGLILNWFKARGEVCTGATEGLNNKIRVVTRRAYGFRTYKAMEIALYHKV